jgi:phosphoribosyl-ATP pyrophosphohydrolase/phosphoribosyl-AMP cyclohydrolase
MSDSEKFEFFSKLKFDVNGLIPAIIQDASTLEVLTVAFMNRDTIELSLAKRETYFWSRSRQEIWHKGATSGNTQKIVTIKADCDGDALLVLVNPQGPACHTGAQSCFYQSIFSETSSGNSQLPQFSKTVDQLVKTIKNRKQHKPEGSYTSYLFTQGRDKILKKIGEESAETIIAAKNLSKRELTSESADLFYHLLVLLINEGVEIGEVIAELDRRAKKRSPEK